MKKGVVIGAPAVTGFVQPAGPAEHPVLVILPVTVQCRRPFAFFIVTGLGIQPQFHAAGKALLIFLQAAFFDVGDGKDGGAQTEQ